MMPFYILVKIKSYLLPKWSPYNFNNKDFLILTITALEDRVNSKESNEYKNNKIPCHNYLNILLVLIKINNTMWYL